MTWIPLLLADPSPCLRLLVLRELLGRGVDDEEVMGLREFIVEDSLVKNLLSSQGEEGSWRSDIDTSLGVGDPLRITAMVLRRLSRCGFDCESPSIQTGVEFIFSRQLPDGSWPLRSMWGGEKSIDTYDLVPMQTCIPLLSIASCGYAQDHRAEKAYQWLLSRRLEDGAWPTGIASGVYSNPAGYRRLAHSRWGCRSNTTAVLLCLSMHPQLKNSQEAVKALDLLLTQEKHSSSSLGFETARLIGVEKMRGFITYYAHNDPALLLSICTRIGASRQDERVEELVNFIMDLQGPYGLWNYENQPQASRWVSFDILNSIAKLDGKGDWISLEPRTPFREYPDKQKRF